MGQIISLATVFVITGNLQLHNCLAISKNAEDREDILSSGLGWLTCFSFLVIIIAAIIPKAFAENNFSLEKAVYLGIMVWILGTANLTLGYYSGESDFRQAGYFSIKRAFLISSMQLAMALKPIGNGLILGIICGELTLRVTSVKIIKKLSLKSWHEKLKLNLKKYHDFTLFGTLQEFVSVFVLMLPLFSFGHLHGDEIGGNYVFAYRMTWAPGMLVAASISPIILRHLSSSNKDIAHYSDFRLIFEFLLIFPVGVLCFNYLLVPIIDWWLASGWNIAVEMMAPLSLWVAAYLSALKTRQLYRVHRLQKWQLLIDAFMASSMAVIFFILKFDLKTLVVASSSIGVLQNFLIVVVFTAISKSRKNRSLKKI